MSNSTAEHKIVPPLPASNPLQSKSKRVTKRRRILLFAFGLFSVGLLAASTALGGFWGRQSGVLYGAHAQATQAAETLLQQYSLGVQDFRQGAYDLARQRFEYVLERDPAFPGAAEMLAQAVAILYATATPTPVPPTATFTPTPDLRPVEDLFSQAQGLVSDGSYDAALEALVSLRRVDPDYRVSEVDGLLYRSLRNRGIIKIRDQSNLEGGIYDLSLAERFGPIDQEAQSYRNLARLYMMGSGFWEVFPEQAVYYFGQVSAAAPYLRDASGWTASARYRAALIQYGDQLLREDDPCQAEELYNLALSYTYEESLAATVTAAGYACRPPTDTPTPELPTATWTLFPTASETVFFTLTPSPTVPVSTETLTPTTGITPVVTTPVATEPVPTTPPEPTTPVPTTPAPTTPVPTTPVPTIVEPTSPPVEPTATPSPTEPISTEPPPATAEVIPPTETQAASATESFQVTDVTVTEVVDG